MAPEVNVTPVPGVKLTPVALLGTFIVTVKGIALAVDHAAGIEVATKSSAILALGAAFETADKLFQVPNS